MSESVLLVWVSTYLVHSTVLLGLTWLLARAGRAGSVSRREWLWRAALLGGLTSATAQTLVDVRPVTGSLPWPRTLEVLARPSEQAPHVTPGRVRAPRGSRAAPTLDAVGATVRPANARRAPIDAGRSVPSAASRGLAPAWILLGSGLWLIALAWRAERALGRRRPLDRGPWYDALRALEDEAGLRRRVRLTVSNRLSAPVALGLLRPEICVPVRAIEGLADDLIRPALAHELAHHVRRDPFWLGVAHLVRSVLLVQPLNRIAARELARLAELSADEWAVRRTGDRLGLARCLTEVAGWLRPIEPPIAACAMVRHGGRLEERVRALLDGTTAPEGGERARRSALFTALVAAPLVLPGWAEASAPEPTRALERIPAAHSSSSSQLARELDGSLTFIEGRLEALALEHLTPKHAAARAALVRRSRALRDQLAVVLAALRRHAHEHENDSPEPEEGSR